MLPPLDATTFPPFARRLRVDVAAVLVNRYGSAAVTAERVGERGRAAECRRKLNEWRALAAAYAAEERVES